MKTVNDFYLPSKHLLVFKTSWRGLQDMSWRCLQHVFRVTIFYVFQDVLKKSWRRFQDLSQDVLKTFSIRLQDVLEDEKLLRWRPLQDVLKTCLEDLLKTYLEDVFKKSRRQTKFLLVISVSNKSKCVSNKSLFHKLCLRNLRRIQNASLRTHNFDIHLILKHTRISILKIKISEASEARKAKF